MTSKQIRQQIRETKREMKAMGVKRTSCFNGGLDRLTYTFNARMFQLTVALDDAVKREAQNNT